MSSSNRTGNSTRFDASNEMDLGTSQEKLKVDVRDEKGTRKTKAAPIGSLMRQLNVYQQKVQYRFPAFESAVKGLIGEVMESCRGDRDQCLVFLSNARHDLSKEGSLFAKFVTCMDEVSSVHGSIWIDIARVWETLAESSKLEEIGIRVHEEKLETEMAQESLFLYVLNAAADFFVYDGAETCFVAESLRQGSRQFAYDAAKMFIDTLSRFMEASLPLDWEGAYGKLRLDDNDLSADSAMSRDGTGFDFAYARFTLTSLQLRIQILETKLELQAQILARALCTSQTAPLKKNLETIVCTRFPDLVFVTVTLTSSLREVLLMNCDGSDRYLSSFSQKEHSLPKELKRVSTRVADTVWSSLNVVSPDSWPLSFSASHQLKKVLVRMLGLVPSYLV